MSGQKLFDFVQTYVIGTEALTACAGLACSKLSLTLELS